MNIRSFIIVIKDILRSRSLASVPLIMLLLAVTPQRAQAQTYSDVTNFTIKTSIDDVDAVTTSTVLYDSSTSTVSVNSAAAFEVLGVSLQQWYSYTNSLYMRWFVVDKNATDYTPSSTTSSWTITPDSPTSYGEFVTFSVGSTNGNEYGKVVDCRGTVHTTSYDYISGCTYTVPESIEDPTQYMLVCFMYNGGTTSNQTYAQPSGDRAINAVAVFNIVTSVDDLPFTAGSTASIGKTNTAEVMTLVTDTQTEAIVGAYSEVYDTNESKYLLGLTAGTDYIRYIRWYMEDVSTGEVIADESSYNHLFATGSYTSSSWPNPQISASDYYFRSNDFYMTYPQDDFAFTLTQWGNTSTNQNILKAALDDMQVTYSGYLKNVRVHCLISTSEPETSGGYVTAEPDFDAEIIFYFKTKEQIDEDYTASDAASGSTNQTITKVLVDAEETSELNTYVVTNDNWSKDETTGAITITSDALTVASDLGGVLDNNTSIHYMRWVELDANGDPVTNSTFLSSLAISDENSTSYGDASQIKYYYNSATGYHIIYSTGSYYHIENLATRLSSVDVSSFDATHSIEIVLSTSLAGLVDYTDDSNTTTAIPFSEPDYDIKITYNYLHAENVATYFYPAESVAQTTLETTKVIGSTDTSTELDAYTDFGTDLSSLSISTAQYIRWSVLDADDNIVTSYNGFSSTSDYAATTCYVDNTANGTVYTLTDASGLDLSTVLEDMTATLPLGDGTGYKVAVLISNSTPQTYYDTETQSYVLNEPVFQVKLVYNLLTKEDIEAQYEAALTNASATNTVTKSVSLSDAISLDAYTDASSYSSAISSATYIRWYITDTEGNIIDATDLFSHSATEYYEDWGGTYISTNISSDDSADNYIGTLLDDITVTGTSLEQGYKIICLVSTEEATKIGDYVSEEPSSYVLKVTYNIVGDGKFHHYIGFEFEDLGYTVDEEVTNPAYEIVNGGIRQQTNEWTYYRYVEPGKTIQLINRVQYAKNQGNDLEPQGYYRWYDFNTDYASDCLSTSTDFGSELALEFYETGNGYRGLFRYAVESGTENQAKASNYAGVNFTAPSDASWEETIIACDVSKYVDGIIEDTSDPSIVFQHEPTLSMRYKFVVRPNTAIAGYLKDALIDTHLPYEDNKFVTFGVMSDGTGTGQIRTDCQRTSDYWFYPCTAPDSAYCDDSYVFTESMFNTSAPVQATKVMWRAYYNDEAYANLSAVECSFDNSSFAHQQEISLSTFNGYLQWYDMDGNTTTVPNAVVGSAYELIAFAIDGTGTTSPGNMCPIARYVVRFIGESPKPFDEIANYRTIDYLEENFTRQAVVSFDNYEGSNLSQPETVLINGNSNAYGIDNLSYSAYGYCYPGLYNYGWRSAMGSYMGLSPLHGDYVLVKSMNLTGVSQNDTPLAGTDGNTYRYRWWDSHELRDRTYLQYSNGSQAGYFLYIDASDEARPIVSVPFEADLCTGSCLLFSAAVTNMTGASIAPQLMFELFGLDTDDEGNEVARHPIHKFNTCDFTSVKADTKGEWQQVYGKVYLQKNAAVENYSDFIVQITNYANGTLGADYAVDDIRFYTQNAKIEVTQSNAVCGEQGALLKMKIAYNTLEALIDGFSTSTNKHFIIIKVCNEDGTDYTDITFPVTGTYYSLLTTNPLVYATDESGNYLTDEDTGFLVLDSSCAAIYDAETGELTTPGYEYDTDGTLYYVFANNDFNLPAGKTFYISAASTIYEQNVYNTVITYRPQSQTYTLSSNFDGSTLEWGSPNETCSLYSNMFSPAEQSVSFGDSDGNIVTKVYFDCVTDAVTPTPIMAQISIPTASGSFVTYPASDTDDLRVDWIITNEDGYAKLTAEDETTGLSVLDQLETALAAFRTDCPNTTSLSSWSSSNTNYSETYYNLLNSYINGSSTPAENATVYAKLFLTDTYSLQSGNLGFEVGNTYYLIARAYAVDDNGGTTVTIDGTTYEICTELMTTSISATYTGPEIAIGFDDVAYPSSRDANIGNVRLGLFQLDAMKTDGAHLHVPVNSITNSSSYETSSTSTEALLTADAEITLASTTDPLATDLVGQTVGWVGQTTIGTDDDNKFVDILFKSGTNTTSLVFHEGYEYELAVLFVDYGQSIDVSNRCTGDAFITLKVVPEYVTWTGAQSNNTNWNNDGNWTRSTKSQLYKTNTNNYEDDSEIFASETDYSQPQTYVPLKFTKVTIPTGASQWPYLVSVTVDRNTGIIENLANRDGSAATSLIEYDMVAKVETECEHEFSTTDVVYDCEKFYANTCDQIYFKPRTQLLLQHYLTYNYAWVEQQLATGEWYILGAPLKDTYAGDMYAPANSSFLGKQYTEAFEPITFNYCAYSSTSTATSTVYNRSTYPIYQRSWDKSVSKEVTPVGDSRGEYYDAFRESVAAASGTELNDYDATELQWSHTYNDVTEKYAPGLGYSLRAYDEAIYPDTHTPIPDSALVRLPKADTEYTYYFYDDYKSTDNGSGTVDKSNYGRFATNATDASDGDYTTTGLLYATPDELQSGGDYYLLSNPYMSSLYALAFLNRNTIFDSSKIWYVSEGSILGASVDATTKLGPAQAFFVKKADGETIDSSTQVVYTLTMTLASSVASTTSEANAVSSTVEVSVKSANGKSTVTIALSDEADSDFYDDEDIESLFDTNLSGRPTLYTVAGSQTVLLNKTDVINCIPLGVVEDEDEELTLTVSGTADLGTTLYLVDAVDGTTTELTDEATVTVRSNDHGRYFITSEQFSPDGDAEYASAIRCYSPQPGTIVCTSATGDSLQDITVYTSAGMAVANLDSVDNVSATINVGSRGVYLVRVTTDNAPDGTSVKVVVK